MVGKIPRREEDRLSAKSYLEKARQSSIAMHLAFEEGLWNAAGENAVRCAIHACDALTVAIGGVRSSSKSHEDAARLLLEVVKGKDVKEMSNRFLGIIRMKNPVDYDLRLLRKRDAQRVIKDADIFLEWVEGRVTNS
jgi:HEPN domain-containing protein